MTNEAKAKNILTRYGYNIRLDPRNYLEMKQVVIEILDLVEKGGYDEAIKRLNVFDSQVREDILSEIAALRGEGKKHKVPEQFRELYEEGYGLRIDALRLFDEWPLREDSRRQELEAVSGVFVERVNNLVRTARQWFAAVNHRVLPHTVYEKKDLIYHVQRIEEHLRHPNYQYELQDQKNAITTAFRNALAFIESVPAASQLGQSPQRGHGAARSALNMTNPTQRDHVFFSYSRKDKKWLELFQKSLRPLIRANQFSVWDDTKIKAGDIWRDEIRQALASAKVAVLLVSMNFYNSDFIAENELPPLLEAAQNEGLKILLVIVGHSLFDETELGRYQAVNDPSKPLATMTAASRDKEIVKICKEIKVAALEGASKAANLVPVKPLVISYKTAGVEIETDSKVGSLRCELSYHLDGKDDIACLDIYVLELTAHNDGDTIAQDVRASVAIPREHMEAGGSQMSEVHSSDKNRLFKYPVEPSPGKRPRINIDPGESSPLFRIPFTARKRHYLEGTEARITVRVVAGERMAWKKELAIAETLSPERLKFYQAQ